MLRSLHWTDQYSSEPVTTTIIFLSLHWTDQYSSEPATTTIIFLSLHWTDQYSSEPATTTIIFLSLHWTDQYSSEPPLLYCSPHHGGHFENHSFCYFSKNKISLCLVISCINKPLYSFLLCFVYLWNIVWSVWVQQTKLLPKNSLQDLFVYIV